MYSCCIYYTDILFLIADISIGFAQPIYSVQESVGTLDTFVFIQKGGGVVTEQVIPVAVQCANGSRRFFILLYLSPLLLWMVC